jgi:intracellular septation protein A
MNTKETILYILFTFILLMWQFTLYQQRVKEKNEVIRKLEQDVRRLQPIEETIYFLEDEKERIKTRN